MSGTKYLGTGLTVPIGAAGTGTPVSPSTGSAQVYAHDQNIAVGPGNKMNDLANLSGLQQQLQTVEYGPSLGVNDIVSGTITGVQTLFSAPTGTAGVVEKFKIIGSGNVMVNAWLQISYDGGNTFPFVAELGTLFGFYPGVEINGVQPLFASCAHIASQQANAPATGGPSSAQPYGTIGNFYATGMLKYPIPFTNGLLIQAFNPTQFGYAGLYTEASVSYCPAADVPPYQLRCTGTNQSNPVAFRIGALTYVGSTITCTIASTSCLAAGANIQMDGSSGGLTTNAPTGTQTVTSVLNGTQFQFTSTNGTPTGSYSHATPITFYNWTTTNTAGQGITLNNTNLPMYGYIFANPTALTTAQVQQLASITGKGWAVGLAYAAQTQTTSTTDDLSYLERNFGWYLDGATPPTISGRVTTPGALNTVGNTTISTLTNVGTACTATLATTNSSAPTAALSVGQFVTLASVAGFTTNNPNGTFAVTGITSTTAFTFTAASAPTGSYTGSSGNMAAPVLSNMTLSNVTFGGTGNLTITATTANATTGLGIGQQVMISGISGFTTNNPNGFYTVTALPLVNQFSYVVATAPTGTYTASTGIAMGSGSPYGTQVGSPTMATTGTEDTFDSCYYAFATAFAWSEGGVNSPVLPASGSAITNYMGAGAEVYIQAPAGGSVSSVVIGTPGESFTTTIPFTLTASETGMVRVPPGGTLAVNYTGTTNITISAITNSGTTCTATVPSTAGFQLGQSVVVAGAAGFTTNNPNGTWTITSIASNGTQFNFVASLAPTGSYTANSGTLTVGPLWSWIVSDFPWGGPTFTYSQPTSMGTANGTPLRAPGTSGQGYYNAFLDILESCGGYRFNSSLQLWLLAESHVDSNGSAKISSCLLYYADLS